MPATGRRAAAAGAHCSACASPATATQRRVQLQNRADANAPWQTVATVDLSARGHFLKSFPARPGSWRLVWTPTPGTTYTSREAVARPR